LRACQIPHAFGGAIAYGYYGVPRATNDFDLNIFLSEDHALKVFTCLEEEGVVWDEASVAAVQSKGQVRLDWMEQKVDLFFSYASLHEAAAKRTVEADMLGTPITILSEVDILIFKTIFDRPHDWRDIQRVFQQGRPVDLPEVLRWLAEILGEDDSRIEKLRKVAAGNPPQ